MDMTTRQILYESNIYEHRSVASTTKIMTCLIACESNKLNDIVTVTSQMLDGTEGSLIYLKAGDKISLYDLCLGMMLSSGNDAANAVAAIVSLLCQHVQVFGVQVLRAGQVTALGLGIGD